MKCQSCNNPIAEHKAGRSLDKCVAEKWGLNVVGPHEKTHCTWIVDEKGVFKRITPRLLIRREHGPCVGVNSPICKKPFCT